MSGESRESPTRGAQVRALLSAWLTIDLLGRGRKDGSGASGTVTNAVFTQGALVFVFASLCFPEVPARAFLAGCLAIVAGFASLASLGELQDQLGNNADRDFVLAGPVSRGTLRRARALHLLLYHASFTVGLAVPPAVLAIWVTGSIWALPLFLAFALLLAALVILSLEVPIVFATRLLGPGKGATVSALLRSVLMGGGFLCLLLGFRAMHQGPEAFPGGLAFLSSLPPYWGARGMLSILGQEASFGHLGLLALVTVSVVLLLTLSSRLPARSGDGPRSEVRVFSSVSRFLARPFAADKRLRGLFDYQLALLFRERSFRLRALPLLGLPIGIVVLESLSGIEPRTAPYFLALVHNLPIAYLPFLILFLPYSESHEAHWLIASSIPEPIRADRRAASMVFAVLLVWTQAGLFVFDATLRGALPALWTSLAALGLSFALLPLLLRELTAPAFSKSPESFGDSGAMGSLLGLGLFVTVGGVFLEVIRPSLYPIVSLALLLGGFLWLRLSVRRGGTSIRSEASSSQEAGQ